LAQTSDFSRAIAGVEEYTFAGRRSDEKERRIGETVK